MPKPTTEAPTNTGTTAKLKAKFTTHLTPDQLAFVNLIEQYWNVHGELMTSAAAERDYFLNQDDFKALLRDDTVKAALVERGVIFLDDDRPDWTAGVLTAQQIYVANVMLDLLDTRSDKKKLQDLEVSTRTYNAWLRNPSFSKYLAQRAESLIGSGQHEAMLALMDKVRAGDMQAIKFYLEYTGKYVSKADTGSTRQGPNAVLDFKNILVKILEVITDEVEDPQVAARIADRLRGIGVNNQTADELLGDHGLTSIQQPEIMPARELTPELQQLLRTGTGVNS